MVLYEWKDEKKKGGEVSWYQLILGYGDDIYM